MIHLRTEAETADIGLACPCDSLATTELSNGVAGPNWSVREDYL